MHHGKSRGKRKIHKICKKKHVKFTKSGGNFEKKEGNEEFPEIGGKCIKIAKIGGIQNACTWSMTKIKVVRNLGRRKSRIFGEKVKLEKNFLESKKFFGNRGGNLKQGEIGEI